MIKILIADDHDVIREGIKSIVSSLPDYQVVAEASDGEQALESIEKHKPDIILLDISMPKSSGLDILSQIHHISPDTKVIIVTMCRANVYITKAFKLGVKGYLHKENVVEDLLPALRRVERGETYMSAKVAEFFAEKSLRKDKETSMFGLTERESDILRLVVKGKTAKEIAQALFISSRTVENYKNNLLKKLGLHKTSELIKYALQQGIIEPEE